MLPLEETLSKMTPEEASEYRDNLRRQHQGTEYTDLIRMVFSDLESAAMHRVKSGPSNSEQLWGLVGALQTIEQAKALLFNEENFNAGTDYAAQ